MYHDDSCIVYGSDKVLCAGGEYVFYRCKSVFVFLLAGFHKKDRPAGGGADTQFFCLVKGFHFRIISQQEFLHKRILVVLFRIGCDKAFNLVDGKFSDGGNAVPCPPDDKDIREFLSVVNFVQAAAGIGHT